jgi:hypothetical protein
LVEVIRLFIEGFGIEIIIVLVRRCNQGIIRIAKLGLVKIGLGFTGIAFGSSLRSYINSYAHYCINCFYAYYYNNSFAH